MMAATRTNLLQFQRQFSLTVFRYHQQQTHTPGLFKGTATCPLSRERNSLFTANGDWKRGSATKFEEEKKLKDGYYAGVPRISQTHSSIFFKDTTTTCHHRLLPSNNLFTSHGTASKRHFATKAGSGYLDLPRSFFGPGQEVKSSAKVYLLVPSVNENLSLKFTHPTCGTHSESVVCKAAYENGFVLVHCGGCNQVVKVVDHSGLFLKPESFKSFVATVEEQVKQSAHKSMSFTIQVQSGGGLKWVLVEQDHLCGDVNVKFIHQCGAFFECRISKEELESGTVVVPCDGCNQLVVFPDYGTGFNDYVEHTFGIETLEVLQEAASRHMARIREMGLTIDPK